MTHWTDTLPDHRPLTRTPVSRRRFLQAGAAGTVAATAAASGALAGVPARRSRAADGLPRNVIFMVSDGMSAGTLSMADTAIRRKTGRPSHWASLWWRPGVRRSMCTTHSADSMVTDSAAAGSAWGIGAKVNNGAICTTPDGRTPEPIFVQAAARGLRTGLVTTTAVTHATPASFVANVPRRSMEGAIAEQIMEHRPDVCLGGGSKFFGGELLDRHRDCTVVRTAAELDAAGSGRLLGLFKRGHMSYEIDRPASEPTLREMTEAALTRLSSAGPGFLLQVEGGRVDHGAHANDAAALLFDQIAFDEAVGAAIAFVDERDDTLLIVTTDHGNANPGLTLYREPGNDGFDRLLKVEHTFEWMFEQLGPEREVTLEQLAEMLGRTHHVALNGHQRDWLGRRLAGQRVDGFGVANGLMPVLGRVLANHLGVSFVSPNHTADLVEVTAVGPGSERLEPVVDNTALHGLMQLALTRAG